MIPLRHFHFAKPIHPPTPLIQRCCIEMVAGMAPLGTDLTLLRPFLTCDAMMTQLI